MAPKWGPKPLEIEFGAPLGCHSLDIHNVPQKQSKIGATMRKHIPNQVHLCHILCASLHFLSDRRMGVRLLNPPPPVEDPCVVEITASESVKFKLPDASLCRRPRIFAFRASKIDSKIASNIVLFV